MQIRKIRQIMTIFLIITTAFTIVESGKESNSIEPYFTLVCKYHASGYISDIVNLAKQQLSRIGINLDIIPLDWPSFVGELIAYRSFDFTYIGLSGGGYDPDFTGVYNENGSLNIFGYTTDMDWNETLGTGTNEWYMKQGLLIMPPDGEERVHHYWAWEQHLMDNILPCFPLLTRKSYVAHWNNLIGYNYSYGIHQSWGKMSWDGTHLGQASTNEIVIGDYSDWETILPTDFSGVMIGDYILDPLVWYDPNCKPYPHLVTNWEHINNTHVRLSLREGIKWQEDPDGYFPNEVFDAEDVYFTLFVLKILDSEYFEIIKKAEIIDKYTIDIFVDGDRSTPENEPTTQYLPLLDINIWPEHYLNQTQLEDGVTPDMSNETWSNFMENPFGTGLFNLDSHVIGIETILQVNSNSWWLNSSITDDPNLYWETRFGDFSSLLDYFRIIILDGINSEQVEFEKGTIDIAGCSYDSQVLNNYIADPNINVQEDLMWQLMMFVFNMRTSTNVIGDTSSCPTDISITKGLAVRKAICHAINRMEINNIIFQGQCAINDYPIYQKMDYWCNPNIIKYKYDLSLSEQYLALAGFGEEGSTRNIGYFYLDIFTGLTLVSIL
ncbi:MAG: ABC transporter substrate-binding protein, partial [Candidatus Thorarchaeota archaeon]